MEFALSAPPAALVEEIASPVTVVDVGCSGGLHPAWRAFGDRLRAVGFDPSEAEVARLRAAETRPLVRYEAAFVSGVEDGRAEPWDRNPWPRLAVSRSEEIRARRNAPTQAVETREPPAAPPAPIAAISLPAYFQEHDLTEIDFIKIDVDGDDFRILRAIERDLTDRAVLGLCIEVNFFGSDDPAANTFHNIDRLMKRAGFELFDLTTRRYASAALPSRYIRTAPTASESGRVLQGDALYMRDPTTWPATRAQRIKLAALFSMFGLPDCAAEALVAAGVAERLLDALTPPSPSGQPQTYSAHMSAFEADDARFYTTEPAPRRRKFLPGW